MSDTTEAERKALLALMPAELRAAIDQGLEVMTTEEMREKYDVEGFMAPFVVVSRKSDGAKGTLQFAHSPRYYFGWVGE